MLACRASPPSHIDGVCGNRLYIVRVEKALRSIDTLLRFGNFTRGFKEPSLI